MNQYAAMHKINDQIRFKNDELMYFCEEIKKARIRDPGLNPILIEENWRRQV
jgi:hypothetical protein